jgi:hypothetical protein
VSKIQEPRRLRGYPGVMADVFLLCGAFCSNDEKKRLTVENLGHG